MNVHPGLEATVLDLAAGLGVGRVGVNAVTWEQLEPTPGAHDWRAVDRLAVGADQRGLEIEVTFQVSSSWGTETTGGSVGAPGSSPPKAEYRDELLRTVRLLVRRLNGPIGARLSELSGPVLAQLMIGNEIELPAHWSANGTLWNPATPQSYFDLVADITAVVHTEDPNLTVVRGSTNLLCLFDDGPTDDQVAARLAELDAALEAELATWLDLSFRPDPPFDVFSLHPNYGSRGVLHQADWLAGRLPPEVGLIAEDMRSTLVSGIDSPVLCPAGETPWPDDDHDGIPDVLETLAAGPSTPGYQAGRSQFEAAQARVTVQKVALAAVSGYDGVFVSTLTDFGVDYPLPEWWFTGLVNRTTLEPRPAYHAYRLLIDELVHAEPVGVEILEDGTVIVSFRRGPCPILVAWGTGDGAVVDMGDRVPGLEVVRRFPAFPDEEGYFETPVDPRAVPLGSTPVLLRAESVTPRRATGRVRGS